MATAVGDIIYVVMLLIFVSMMIGKMVYENWKENKTKALEVSREDAVINSDGYQKGYQSGYADRTEFDAILTNKKRDVAKDILKLHCNCCNGRYGAPWKYTQDNNQDYEHCFSRGYFAGYDDRESELQNEFRQKEHDAKLALLGVHTK